MGANGDIPDLLQKGTGLESDVQRWHAVMEPCPHLQQIRNVPIWYRCPLTATGVER